MISEHRLARTRSPTAIASSVSSAARSSPPAQPFEWLEQGLGPGPGRRSRAGSAASTSPTREACPPLLGSFSLAAPARRDRRPRPARTAPARRRSAKIAAGLLEPDRRARSSAHGRAAYLSRIRAGTSPANAATTRWRSARGDGSGSHGHSPPSGSTATRRGTRAICRAGSASGSRWRPCSLPSPTCSSSTSRRAVSIRSARQQLAALLRAYCPGARDAVRHARPRARRGRRRPHGRARRRGRACRCLGSRPWPRRARPSAAAAWTALAPGRRGRSRCCSSRSRSSAPAYAWLESGPGLGRRAGAHRRAGGIAAAGRVLFAAVPGVQPVTVIAVAAGAALGARAGIAVGATAALVVEPLPRAGPLDALADARLGRLRPSRRARPARDRARSRSRCSAPSSASLSARSWTCGCGSASIPHTWGGVHRRARARRALRPRARDRQLPHRARRRA